MIDADELRAACRTAFQRSGGTDALTQLGFDELLPALDDPFSRQAVMATFEAQGHELADTPALARLVGQPYAELLSHVVHGTAWSKATGGGLRHLLVGPVPTGELVLDTPGVGAVVVATEAVRLRPLVRPGRFTIHEVDIDGVPVAERLGDDVIAEVRSESLRFARTALAFEMLGAARAAVNLALEHARSREQFGQAIGGFQAVQHLLAWATTDCEALASLAGHAGVIDGGPAGEFALAAKALAGRNALRACERSLQVLGAIGFTAEHDHHHFHSRVLALDALLGTRAQLTRQLGESWRTDISERGIPAGVLRATHYSSA